MQPCAGKLFHCSAKFANRSHTPTIARDRWLEASIFGTSPHRHGCTRIPTPQERCTRISTPLERCTRIPTPLERCTRIPTQLERCMRISTLLGLHEDSRERCTTTTEISRLHLTCCLILPCCCLSQEAIASKRLLSLCVQWLIQVIIGFMEFEGPVSRASTSIDWWYNLWLR